MRNLSFTLALSGLLLVGCTCPECPEPEPCPECPPEAPEEIFISEPALLDAEDTTEFISISDPAATSSTATTVACGKLVKYYQDVFQQKSTLTLDFSICNNGQIQFIVFTKGGGWVSSKTKKAGGTTNISLPADGKLYVLCAAGNAGQCDVTITAVSFP